jgi:hypothetical protein
MVGAEDIKQYIYYYKATKTEKPIFLGNKTTYQTNFDGAVVVVAGRRRFIVSTVEG